MTKTSKKMRALLSGLLAVMLLGVFAFGAMADERGEEFALTVSTSQEALSVKDIAKKNIPSIVSINTESTYTYYTNDYYSSPFGSFGFGYGYGYGQGNNNRGQRQEVKQTGAGTGIIISQDGYIVTNNHVIDGAEKIVVTLSDETTEYEATVIGASVDNDIAVIKVDAKDLTPAVFGDSDLLEIGDDAIAIGNALGKLSSTVTKGIISSTAREMTIDDVTITALQTDAPVNSGNSGGALINGAGEVIGIVYAKGNDMYSDGIAYAIPVNTVKPIIEDMINHPEKTAAQTAGSQIMLGITGYTITEEMQKAYTLPGGVYVKEISDFSAAERAGLQVGDIIVNFAGEEITSMDQLNAIKAEQTSGDEVEMVVDRNNREVTLTIVIPQPQETAASNQ